MKSSFRIFATGLMLTLLFPLTALAAGSKKVEEDTKKPYEALYNEGVDLLKEKDFAAAQKKFEESLALKEDFAQGHNNLAYSLRKQSDRNFKKALEHYNRALELDPKLAQAYHYRGILHALSDNAEDAMKDHKKLLELDRDLAEELLAVVASGEEPAESTGGMTQAW